MPPGNPSSIQQVTNDVSAWHDEVVKFSSAADLKLNTSLLSGPSVFLPPAPPNRLMFRKAKYAMQLAQYRLKVTQAQLNASRESSKVASDKLTAVNRQLGYIMAKLAKIDVQKQNVGPFIITLPERKHLLMVIRCSGRRSPVSCSKRSGF